MSVETETIKVNHAGLHNATETSYSATIRQLQQRFQSSVSYGQTVSLSLSLSLSVFFLRCSVASSNFTNFIRRQICQICPIDETRVEGTTVGVRAPRKPRYANLPKHSQANTAYKCWRTGTVESAGNSVEQRRVTYVRTSRVLP